MQLSQTVVGPWCLAHRWRIRSPRSENRGRLCRACRCRSRRDSSTRRTCRSQAVEREHRVALPRLDAHRGKRLGHTREGALAVEDRQAQAAVGTARATDREGEVCRQCGGQAEAAKRCGDKCVSEHRSPPKIHQRSTPPLSAPRKRLASAMRRSGAGCREASSLRRETRGAGRLWGWAVVCAAQVRPHFRLIRHRRRESAPALW